MMYEKMLIFYLVAANAIGFALMGIDKRKAIRGAYRIPEASLFRAAVLGGSLGCILGMRCFRHKTRHPKFQYGMPLILMVQVCVYFLVMQYLP